MMKKVISAILGMVTLGTILVGCTPVKNEAVENKITVKQDTVNEEYKAVADKIVNSFSNGKVDTTITFDGYKKCVEQFNIDDIRLDLRYALEVDYGENMEYVDQTAPNYNGDPDSSFIKHDSDGDYIMLSEAKAENWEYYINYKGYKILYPIELIPEENNTLEGYGEYKYKFDLLVYNDNTESGSVDFVYRTENSIQDISIKLILQNEKVVDAVIEANIQIEEGGMI